MVSDRSVSRLWYLTGFAALLLLCATFALAFRAGDLADSGYSATLRASGGPVLVREGPSGLDPIITILPQGTPVFVTDSIELEGRTWVLIETDEIEGWVPVELVRVSP